MSSLTLHKGTVSETKTAGEQWPVPHAPETQPPPPSMSLHLKCSPSQHIVAPGCHRGPTLWAGRRRTSEAHLKEGVKKKIPISASRVKYLRKEEKKLTMQRLLLYSGHSINQLWNKSWRGIQRATAKKGKGGVTVILKDVRKLGFLRSCSSHLLQLWLENAVCYCVITLSNQLDGTCPATHTKPCPRSNSDAILGEVGEVELLIYTKTCVGWIHLMTFTWD